MPFLHGWQFNEQKVQFYAGRFSSTGIIEVHSGSVPATIDGWNPAANMGTLLCTFPSGTVNFITSDEVTTPASGLKLYLNGTSPVQLASGTGTATWAVMYSNTDNTLAIMGETTLSGGNGAFNLSTLTLQSGVTNVTLIDVNFTFYYLE